MTRRESPVPARRASDAERERAAELLQDAVTAGKLGVAERVRLISILSGGKVTRKRAD